MKKLKIKIQKNFVPLLMIFFIIYFFSILLFNLKYIYKIKLVNILHYSKINKKYDIEFFKNIGAYNVLKGEENRQKFNLDLFKKYIKGKKLSYFGKFPAVMAYNDFNYISFPTTISFVGWNDFLIKKDYEFIKEKLPDFIIYDLKESTKSVNELFRNIDSPKAHNFIIKNYSLVRGSDGFPLQIREMFLLKKNTKILDNVEKNFIKKFNIHPVFKPPIKVSSTQILKNEKDILYLSIKTNENLLEKIIATFYKPPVYSMYLSVNDKNFIKPISLKKIKYGFPIDPLVLNSNEMKNFLKKNYLNKNLNIQIGIGCYPKFLCNTKKNFNVIFYTKEHKFLNE